MILPELVKAFGGQFAAAVIAPDDQRLVGAILQFPGNPILNTVEINEAPDAACAAQQNIDDSAERLLEILEVYQ